MKNLNLLKPLFLFVFLGLCSTACNDDDGHIPMPNPGDECRLISGIADTVAYNAQGYVSKLTSYYSDTSEFSSTSRKFTYNADNQVIKQETFMDGGLFYYFTYAYTDRLLTSSAWLNSEGSNPRTTTFEYDSKKRLTKSISDDGSPTTTFAYDSNDNLVEVKLFYDGELYSISTYEDYDNHPTPFSAVKGLPPLEDYRMLSKNNPGKWIVLEDTNKDGTLQSSEKTIITYRYVYNSNGYPSKIAVIRNGSLYYTNNYKYQCK